MVNHRIVERPAFGVVGKKAWIGGQDNSLFGRFWEQLRAEGLLERLRQIRQANGQPVGPQTGGVLLGVSRVEQDPANRDFYYMIASEAPSEYAEGDLEAYQVPASTWAVFECRGPVPQAIVEAEMYAFGEWLPASGYTHALAPEMEVYLPTDEAYCEFWLPIAQGAISRQHTPISY